MIVEWVSTTTESVPFHISKTFVVPCDYYCSEWLKIQLEIDFGRWLVSATKFPLAQTSIRVAFNSIFTWLCARVASSIVLLFNTLSITEWPGEYMRRECSYTSEYMACAHIDRHTEQTSRQQASSSKCFVNCLLDFRQCDAVTKCTLYYINRTCVSRRWNWGNRQVDLSALQCEQWRRWYNFLNENVSCAQNEIQSKREIDPARKGIRENGEKKHCYRSDIENVIEVLTILWRKTKFKNEILYLHILQLEWVENECWALRTSYITATAVTIVTRTQRVNYILCLMSTGVFAVII